MRPGPGRIGWSASFSVASFASTTLAVSALTLVGSASAFADSAPAPPPSAVQQYIETLPTGGGSHPLTSGGSSGGLSPALEKRIDADGGPYAAMLKAIAGSPKTGPTGATTEEMSPSAAPKASVVLAALDSGSGTNTLFVVMVGVAFVVASVLAAVRRQTRRRARLP